MYCGYCGKELTEESSYCKRCGASVPEEILLEIERGKRMAVSQRVLSSIRNVAESVGIQDRTGPERGLVNTDHVIYDSGGPEEIRTTLTTGCKVWFWIVLIVNTIFAILMTFVSSSPISYLVPSAGMGTLSCAAMAIGAGFILFARKKIGLYIIFAGAAIGFISNITSGINFGASLLGGFINPLICYYFVNKNSDVIV